MHMLRKVRELRTYTLQVPNGFIGEIGDLYFDDATWTVRYLVANGSAWLSSRQVLISPIALGKIDDMKNTLDVNLTVEQVGNSPSIDSEKPVSREYEAEYYRYYGWPFYWVGEERWGWATYPMDMRLPGMSDTLHAQNGDPHLRSVEEVMGYQIQARDGDIGRVVDFIVNDETWALRYLVITTRALLSGRQVLISPHWIENINWERSTVTVDLLRESIQSAPEYDPQSVVTRSYEIQLFNHFGREEDFDAVYVGHQAGIRTK
jgi:hypothetical protein